jgi:hypothetical protein
MHTGALLVDDSDARRYLCLSSSRLALHDEGYPDIDICSELRGSIRGDLLLEVMFLPIDW